MQPNFRCAVPASDNRRSVAEKKGSLIARELKLGLCLKQLKHLQSANWVEFVAIVDLNLSGADLI